MSHNKKNKKPGPVHEALLSCSKDKIKELVKRNPELKENILLKFLNKLNCTTLIPSPKNDVDRFLYFSISEGNIEVCKYLLDDKSEVNRPSAEVQPLTYAIIKNKPDIVKLLIDYGADLYKPDEEDKLPLAHAIKHPIIVEHILKAGFPVNHIIEIYDEVTALHVAVSLQATQTVMILLKYGANINAISIQGATPLNFAIYGNYPQMLNILLDHGAKVDDNFYLTSPIMEAINLGHREAVRLLIDKGASVDEAKMTNVSIAPLHYAVEKCKPKIVKLLLESGADVDVKNKNGNSPLLEAAAKKFSTMGFFLYPEDRRNFVNMKKSVDILLEFGADIGVRGIYGTTPLQLAILLHNNDIVLAILSARGKPDQSLNLLRSAVRAQNVPAVKALLEFGEDYNTIDSELKSAYHYALEKKGPEMLNIFWKHGCLVDQFSESSPLPQEDFDVTTCMETNEENKVHIKNQERYIKAVFKNDKGTVLDTLKKGAEPRGRSVRVKSPMHLVCKRGDLEIAEVLLGKGVPPNIIFEEATPLHLAASEGHEEVCKLLLRHGACFNCTVGGKTPLQCAQLQEIKKFLKSVQMYFKLAKSGEPKLITELKQCADTDLGKFLVFMNSVNRQGCTLMGVAFLNNHTGIAKEIMSLRLKYVVV